MRRKIQFFSIFVIVIISCSPISVESTATSTEISLIRTNTPLPPSATNTATSTLTPSPTATNTPTSTNTLIPPTNTATFTPIPEPIVGNWRGETEGGFPISFKIEEEDGKIFIKDLRLIIQFSCKGADIKVDVTILPYYEKQQITDGEFEFSTKRISIRGQVYVLRFFQTKYGIF